MLNKDTVIVSLIAAATAALLIPIALGVEALPFALSPASILAWITAVIVLENVGLLIARSLAVRWRFFMKLARFTSTGIFNTMLDTSIITTLAFFFGIYTGHLLAFFNILSFSTTTLVSYFINRNWSFATDESPSVREFSGFVGVTISSMILNTGLVYIFTTHVSALPGTSPAQWLAIVKLLGVLVSFVWNFSWFQFVIFRNRSISSPANSSNV